MVVTPAASLVEPPSRCRRTAERQGEGPSQNDAFRGVIQEADMEKLWEVNLKKKIDQKNLESLKGKVILFLNV